MSKVSCPLHLFDTGGSAAKGADIFRISVVLRRSVGSSQALPAESLCPELLWPQRDSRRRAPVRARSVRTSHRSSLDDARHTSGEGTGKTHYCDRITQTRATATTTAISERLPGQTATATDAERGISGAIPSHAISVTTCSSSAPRGSKPVPAQHDIRESAGRHRTSCSVPPGGTSLPAPGRTGAAR